MKNYLTNYNDELTVVPNRPVTREMVYSRTLELASLAGRSPLQIKQVDYERAKREMTGESDFERQQEMLDVGCAAYKPCQSGIPSLNQFTNE